MSEKKFRCSSCGSEFSSKCPICGADTIEISQEFTQNESNGCPTDEIKRKFNEALENGKKAFLCPACAHKDVCSKIDEPSRQCENFLDATEPLRYPSIYHMFQPIFDWLKYHYPSGEVKFIVDQSSAKMFIEHGPSAYSKEITDLVCNAKGEKSIPKVKENGAV